VIDIDERVRPKPPLQFLSADHFTRPLQQNGQNGKWLTGQFQLTRRPPQLSRPKVNFEYPKADSPRGMGSVVHGSRLPSSVGLCRHRTTV
jgi:hypothetical protein